MNILIKNGYVVDPKNNLEGYYDIFIEEGSVSKVNENIDIKNCEIIDAEGKMVCPGFVDAHVHLRIPGFDFKEDLISGTKAALRGGVTSVAAMPNTKPVIDTINKLNDVKRRIEEEALIEVFPIVSVTKDQDGKELVDFKKLENETVAFSDDGMPIMDKVVLEKAFECLPDSALIISHCEDFNVSKLYTDGPWPCIGESKMVKRNVEVAKKYNKRIHIAHISCKDSLDSIVQAKSNGTKVTCEVTPHHFSLSKEEVNIKSTYTKVNPPIRSKENLNAIIEGIKNNQIDIIATDHAPHEKESKEVEYQKASNGISGVETSFSLAYTNLVKKEGIELSKIIAMMTFKPAEILGIKRGSIGVGDIADIAIIDLNKKWEIESENFMSKGKNTPFEGYGVYGEIETTIKNGIVKFKRGAKYEY
ncbi:dihydroorotase [Clostridiaceae bacterium HSG29]|nr:dihydroorotase [Clostridiaceae bacterium HSG29]